MTKATLLRERVTNATEFITLSNLAMGRVVPASCPIFQNLCYFKSVSLSLTAYNQICLTAYRSPCLSYGPIGPKYFRTCVAHLFIWLSLSL